MPVRTRKPKTRKPTAKRKSSSTPPNIFCDKCKTGAASKLKKCGDPRLPRNWVDFNGEIWCVDCWRDEHRMRTVVIPVTGPVNCNWSELKTQLALWWSESTRLANWTVRELMKRDVVVTKAVERLPGHRSPYLYPEANEFCSLPSGAVVSILNNVSRKYSRAREEILLLSKQSAPVYKYPHPVPFHRESWKIETTKQAVFILVGGLKLRLRGGARYRYHLGFVRRIAAGEYRNTELAIYQRRTSHSNHRNGVDAKAPGGGQKKKHDVVLKICAWVPRCKISNPENTIYLSTTEESFWSAVIQNADGKMRESPPWVLNADHLSQRLAQVERWLSDHARRLQRFSQDTKAEKRWPKKKRIQLNERRDAFCEKQHRRINTFIDEAIASFVKWAIRMKAEAVVYRDTEVMFAKFPWYRVKERLFDKLSFHGIKAVHDEGKSAASGKVERYDEEE